MVQRLVVQRLRAEPLVVWRLVIVRLAVPVLPEVAQVQWLGAIGPAGLGDAVRVRRRHRAGPGRMMPSRRGRRLRHAGWRSVVVPAEIRGPGSGQLGQSVGRLGARPAARPRRCWIRERPERLPRRLSRHPARREPGWHLLARWPLARSG
ncbi:MAG: hypothetical protein LBI49_06855 [Nocardiopsaceae bacterium]|nr:hypothetical protein [Nocardiopsaceae bacterium]